MKTEKQTCMNCINNPYNKGMGEKIDCEDDEFIMVCDKMANCIIEERGEHQFIPVAKEQPIAPPDKVKSAEEKPYMFDLFETINRITNYDCLESELDEIVEVTKKYIPQQSKCNECEDMKIWREHFARRGE